MDPVPEQLYPTDQNSLTCHTNGCGVEYESVVCQASQSSPSHSVCQISQSDSGICLVPQTSGGHSHSVCQIPLSDSGICLTLQSPPESLSEAAQIPLSDSGIYLSQAQTSQVTADQINNGQTIFTSDSVSGSVAANHSPLVTFPHERQPRELNLDNSPQEYTNNKSSPQEYTSSKSSPQECTNNKSSPHETCTMVNSSSLLMSSNTIGTGLMAPESCSSIVFQKDIPRQELQNHHLENRQLADCLHHPYRTDGLMSPDNITQSPALPTQITISLAPVITGVYTNSIPDMDGYNCHSSDMQSINHSESEHTIGTYDTRKNDRLTEENESRQSTSSKLCSDQEQNPHGKKRSLGHQCIQEPLDCFAYQTKFVVLQFLKTNTCDYRYHSQSSLSTASELGQHYQSHTHRLRKIWQDNKSHSLPSSPHAERKIHPLVKTKGNHSSPDLKQGNFFKFDAAQHLSRLSPRFYKRKRVLSRKKEQEFDRQHVMRSVSQTTENSDLGPFDTNSDADDELNSSFDSSHQGSVTSAHFRNRIVHLHSDRLPTVRSESECREPLDGESAELYGKPHSPPLSLDMIAIEDASSSLDSPNYISELDRTPITSFSIGGLERNSSETMLQNSCDEGSTANSAHETQHPHPTLFVARDIESPDIKINSRESPQGAVGGDAVDDCGRESADCSIAGRTADRSKLRLELSDPCESLVPEVIDTLMQELEEEMSSFESEYEEVLQMSCQGRSPSHSRCLSPETEVASTLKRIGDEVQQQYFQQLDVAVHQFLGNCAGILTYENFRDAAMLVLDSDLNGWKQVAILLLYSQYVAFQLASSGHRGLRRIIEYTVQLLADTASNFIINHGGWAGISGISSDIINVPNSDDLDSVSVDPTGQSLVAEENGSDSSSRVNSISDLHSSPGQMEDTFCEFVGGSLSNTDPQTSSPVQNDSQSTETVFTEESEGAEVTGLTEMNSCEESAANPPSKKETNENDGGALSSVQGIVERNSWMAKCATLVGFMAVVVAVVSLSRS